MQYFLLGLAALLLGLLALDRFASANMAVLARQLRLAGGAAALTGAALLVFRGFMSYALPLAMLGSWLLWGRGGAPWGASPGQPRTPQGQTSRVATEHLEMELDHDTGALRGRIVKGPFAGREIESLTPGEMALVWRDCRFSDPPSAQLIETYLDRAHPTWREDLARGERNAETAGDGRMTVAEAYEILGLEPGAGEDEVRRAHRALMQKLHPDHGGSGYLAARINEAKDLLLRRR